jgi:hypothetical protein
VVVLWLGFSTLVRCGGVKVVLWAKLHSYWNYAVIQVLPPLLVLVTSPTLLVKWCGRLIQVLPHLLVLVTSPTRLVKWCGHASVTSPLSASYLPYTLSEMMRSYKYFKHVSKMPTLSHNRENNVVIKNAIILTVDYFSFLCLPIALCIIYSSKWWLRSPALFYSTNIIHMTISMSRRLNILCIMIKIKTQ